MRLGGLLKFSMIDYPGRLAAVIFTQGCNYRCPFCHNPELVLPDLFLAPLRGEEVFSFLEKRRGQLQAVVVTGGEPTLHHDLPEFLARIKAMGYLVKLDTNGTRPDMLRDILVSGNVDYVAMDIKSSPEGYCKATGIQADIAQIRLSVALIRSSGIVHEFRTTAFKAILAESDMKGVVDLVGTGVVCNVRRGNLKGKILSPEVLMDAPDYTDEEWKAVLKIAHQPEAS